jgi:uncharacterized NAD-dependent epimerase/dehydratase family protein
MASRRMLLMTEGRLGVFDSKTATCLLRYCASEVVGIVDSHCIGVRTSEILGVDRDVPVVARVSDALYLNPDCLVIGIAPQGGALTGVWRDHVLDAIHEGLNVISGLHAMLNDDPEMASAARAKGVKIWDVRRPPADISIASARALETRALRILTVGTDCNLGKMVTAYELTRALQARGLDACFVPTGQTGIIIAGWGIAIDRVVSDFTAGAVERLVLEQADRDILVIEGQGSLLHPAYSGVTLSLLHGSLPDGIILCHQPRRTRMRGNNLPIAPLSTHIELCRMLADSFHLTQLIGVSLNGFGISDEELRREVDRVQSETGLPTTDVIRFGPDLLAGAIEGLHRSVRDSFGSKIS